MQQRAKLPGYGSSLVSSTESSVAPTPSDLLTPPNEPTSRPVEPLRRGSLGSFLKAAGVESSESRPDNRRGSKIRKMSSESSNSINISSRNSTHIVLPSSAAHTTSSGTLMHLHRCVVDMSVPTSTGQPFAGLTVKDVKQCLLVCGNVSGSAHVTGVEDSIILVTAKQFRMHECKNCVVYLHVSSQPIIEDCHGIQFAQLPKKHVRSPFPH